MKILQIIPTLNTGGAERTTLDVAKAIIDEGGQAFVVSQGGRLVLELEASGAIHIDFPVAKKNPIQMIKNIFLLRNLIRNHKIDIIHARSRAPAWSALAAARLAGIPFITTYHGIYNSKNAIKRFYNSIMARGDVVIANSAFTARHIETQHPQAIGKIQIIPRGTDFERLDPAQVSDGRVAALRIAWGILQIEDRIVLLPARLTRWKGQLVLIEAIALLKREDMLPADVRIVLAGDAQGRVDYVQELETAIANAGLQGIIIIAPHITDMPAAYKAANIVVVPSTDPEAFGRVPVEAQAMEIPVIVSAHGAPLETVIEAPEAERTGWLVAPSDPQALANALQQVWALSHEARRILGQRARAHVLNKFSLAQMTQATLKIYRNLLKNA